MRVECMGRWWCVSKLWLFNRRRVMKYIETVLGGIVMVCVMIFGVVAAAMVYPILLFLDWIMGNKIQ